MTNERYYKKILEEYGNNKNFKIDMEVGTPISKQLLKESNNVLKLESFLEKWKVDWMKIGGEFDADDIKKKVIVRSQTTPLTLSESIDVQEDIERDKKYDYLRDM